LYAVSEMPASRVIKMPEGLSSTPSRSDRGRGWKKRLNWKVLIISRRALRLWIIILAGLLLLLAFLLFSFREAGIEGKAKEAISSAQKALDSAYRAGAEIFAYERYAQALAELSKAKKFHQAGDFKTSYDHAVRAEGLARRAEAEMGKQGIAASRFSTVSATSGKVEIRRARELSWQPVSKGMNLFPQDQIRTFSHSQVQLTFDDGSVLRVKPDSLVVIDDLSQEAGTSRKRTSVRLLVSDIEARIGGPGAERSEFRIEMPTAVARAERAELAVRVSPERESKIRVFSGSTELTSGGKTLRLESGQEVIATRDQKLVASSQPLLPPPTPITPVGLKQFLFADPKQAKIPLAWTEVPGAKSYHLQVASDPLFFDPILDLGNLNRVEYDLEKVESGTYFWRVSCLNANGSEGTFCDLESFQVGYTAAGLPLRIEDILVLTGRGGNTVWIKGKTEPSRSLQVNHLLIKSDSEGTFWARLTPVPRGRLTVTFRIPHPQGGCTIFQKEILVTRGI